MGHEWTNLSYANVATTSAVAHKASRNWEDSLARGGAAEFDADAEKLGMMPLREAAAKLLSCHHIGCFLRIQCHCYDELSRMGCYAFRKPEYRFI